MSRLDKELEDVRSFHRRFDIWQHSKPGHLSGQKLRERIAFLQEELDELKQALETNDLSDQADALVDLVYVAKGTALMLGLPWEEMWDEVQRANMAKVRGQTKRGNKIDVTKPPGWEPPNHNVILIKHGYKSREWLDSRGHLLPEVSRDDDVHLCTCGYKPDPMCEVHRVR